jgi:hypothetical protein
MLAIACGDTMRVSPLNTQTARHKEESSISRSAPRSVIEEHLNSFSGSRLGTSMALLSIRVPPQYNSRSSNSTMEERSETCVLSMCSLSNGRPCSADRSDRGLRRRVLEHRKSRRCRRAPMGEMSATVALSNSTNHTLPSSALCCTRPLNAGFRRLSSSASARIGSSAGSAAQAVGRLCRLRQRNLAPTAHVRGVAFPGGREWGILPR